MNEITETTESIAPNSKRASGGCCSGCWQRPRLRGEDSISDWMRWSGVVDQLVDERPR